MLHEGVHLDEAAERLQLKAGDRILLYQDDDDFEVEATLDHRHFSCLLGAAWIAVPDWTTLRDIEGPPKA